MSNERNPYEKPNCHTIHNYCLIQYLVKMNVNLTSNNEVKQGITS